MVKINNKQRVGKYGRLLAIVMSMGMNVGKMMIMQGLATTFENRNEGKIPVIESLLQNRDARSFMYESLIEYFDIVSNAMLKSSFVLLD